MNRHKYILGLLLLLAFMMMTCSTEPGTLPALTVDFTTAATPTLDYPVEVRFTNRSDSSNAVQWDFGDGNSSPEQSPVRQYVSSGSFPVRLTVTRGAVSQSVSKRVEVPYRRLSVTVFYVIPSERTFDLSLLRAIKQAMPVVQTWYNQQLAARTFHLNQPVVDTLHARRYGYDYGTTSIDMLNNLSDEVYRHAAAKINPNEQIILLFYPIGIPGAVGVGVARQQDGLSRRVGVIGVEACQSLTKAITSERSLGLWTTAHELGHALGLVHTLVPGALMFGPVMDGEPVPDVPLPTFPECPLTPADLQTLTTSPFLR